MSQIRKYFNQHIVGINESLDAIDQNLLDKLLDYFRYKNGNMFLTGIGKNGHVAAKAVSTLNSMGIKVFYIDPVDAVHGDVGIVDINDTIIAISKSGETDELINFLHHVNKRTQHICLIHSNKGNRSLEYCELDLFVPIKYEADYLNKVPTVSIAVYTILLQSISCLLAEENNLDMKSFIFNHPGGSIGKTKI
jgi:arabinose-5-phosphate isomerase